MASSIWNLMSPLRNNAKNLKLMPNGQEFYGTVIKSGVNDKTVTVRVDYQYYVKKYKCWAYKFSKFLVHDEENFAISGDKVVIKSMFPVSTRKHYFLRNVVKPFPRMDYYLKEKTEKDIKFEETYKNLYKEFYKNEIDKTVVRNAKEEQTLKAKIKARAMAKVI